jgi:Fe-S oxidoreductase
MPSSHVCCGRPLYDYGFLDVAERYLRRTLDVLRVDARAGTPIVGMEPSCVAVFKDELPKMLPHDDDAKRLVDAIRHWSEFFEELDLDVPRLERRALLRGHCHHKATGGMDPEQRLLSLMGVDVEPVNGGCCGLAGSWGFESGKHDISMQCGITPEKALGDGRPTARPASKRARALTLAGAGAAMAGAAVAGRAAVRRAH